MGEDEKIYEPTKYVLVKKLKKYIEIFWKKTFLFPGSDQLTQQLSRFDKGFVNNLGFQYTTVWPKHLLLWLIIFNPWFFADWPQKWCLGAWMHSLLAHVWPPTLPGYAFVAPLAKHQLQQAGRHSRLSSGPATGPCAADVPSAGSQRACLCGGYSHLLEGKSRLKWPGGIGWTITLLFPR